VGGGVHTTQKGVVRGVTCFSSSATHILRPSALLNQYSARIELEKCFAHCGGPGVTGSCTLCPGKSSTPRPRHCGPPPLVRASAASRAAGSSRRLHAGLRRTGTCLGAGAPGPRIGGPPPGPP